MKLRLISAIVLASVLFGSMSFAFAAAPSDALWERALAVVRRNADWVAGLVVTRSEVLYKGETNGVHEIWKRSRLGTDAEVITDTVKVLEDGKDVTAQEKKKEKGKSKKPNGQASLNPFDEEIQDRLSLAVTNRSRNIAGKDCVGYVFEVRNPNGPRAQGVAWLERQTGIPTELENVTLDPLPDKHLKGMTITTRYESTADGVWRVKEICTITKVSMFFITADVQSIMTFTDYWKRSPHKVSAKKDER
jgi:hypothetical protein